MPSKAAGVGLTARDRFAGLPIETLLDIIQYVTFGAIGLLVLIVALIVLLMIVAFVADSLGLLNPYKEQHKGHRKRAKAGKGLGINELARRLGMEVDELKRFDPSYTRTSIPKKRGGQRTLHVPNDKTKQLQRRILRLLLKGLKTHEAATGFEPGKSIAHNAAAHVGQAVVIKMDIKDFFSETADQRVEQYFRRVGWDAECAALLARLVTYKGGLPQGAPTSPRLSNLVNYVLDCQIQRYVERRQGTYTRYADDITVSYPEDRPKAVRGTLQTVRRVCRRHGYTVHMRGKLRILRRHQQQRVTGLVVNDKVQLTREKRRWLRAVKHRMETTGKATITEEQLAGWLALERMIEQQTSEDKADP